jgi:hypothetical protein
VDQCCLHPDIELPLNVIVKLTDSDDSEEEGDDDDEGYGEDNENEEAFEANNENEETFLNLCKEEEGWNVLQVPEKWNPHDPLYTPLWRSSVN